MIIGLTGFAVSQPLLAVAGEDPTLFTFAGVRGWGLVVFALVVAFLPPLVLWAVVVISGLVHRRAGDLTFLVVAGLLAAATAIQWVKAAGVEAGWALAVVGLLAGFGFAVALARFAAVAIWTRFTAPLPVLAVVLLLVASPAGDLLRSPTATGPVAGRAGNAPDVVFIMLDELPLKTLLDLDDQIDPVRFPNLARLADRSTWYRDYTVLSDRTLHSVPSMLTGHGPRDDPPLWTAHPDNLFSLLVETHRFTVAESITQLCGFSTCGLEGSGSDRADPTTGVAELLSQMVDVWTQRVRLGPVDDMDYGQFEEEVVPLQPGDDPRPSEDNILVGGNIQVLPQRAMDFLDAVEPTSAPGLFYLHLMLPHQPWVLYPDGQMFAGPLAFIDEDPEDPWVMAQYEQIHILQTQYTDRVVGEILDHLEDLDLFEDSLIILTADHGVSFDADSAPGLRRLSEETLGDLAYVPLIVKSPGQTEGRVDDSNLMAVDVLPLIAHEMDIEIPWEVDGFAPGSPEISARGDTKQIYDFGGGLLSPFEGAVDYEGSAHRPRARDRLVGPIDAGDGLLDGLMAYLGAEDHIGRSLTGLDPEPGGGAEVPGLDVLRDPTPGRALPGRVTGDVDDPALGDLLLVSVGGTVVSAAPVNDNGSFSTLLPPGALARDGGNEVALVQVGPRGAHLLDLTD